LRNDQILPIYVRHLTGFTTVNPGARQAIAAVRSVGIATAVVTNKQAAFARIILEHFELLGAIGTVIGGDSCYAKKPAPDMLVAACERLKASPRDTLMIGDGSVDLLAARAVGMDLRACARWLQRLARGRPRRGLRRRRPQRLWRSSFQIGRRRVTMLKALVFDVDGTLAETEELHRRAFNEAFEEAGIDWMWSRDLYRELLSTTGGRERIFVYAERVGAEVDAPALHARKTRIYGEMVRSGVVNLRPGVVRLVERAKSERLALAIGTTTSRPIVSSFRTPATTLR
jgi:beta-phosphoglucomutase-like phosphatase (HAD superfamily)